MLISENTIPTFYSSTPEGPDSKLTHLQHYQAYRFIYIPIYIRYTNLEFGPSLSNLVVKAKSRMKIREGYLKSQYQSSQQFLSSFFRCRFLPDIFLALAFKLHKLNLTIVHTFRMHAIHNYFRFRSMLLLTYKLRYKYQLHLEILLNSFPLYSERTLRV